MFNWLTDTDTFRTFDQRLAEQVSGMNPQHLFVIMYIILALILLFFAVKIFKAWKAPNNHVVNDLNRNLKETSDDSNQKSLIMTLIDQLTIEVNRLVYDKNAGVDERILEMQGRKIIDMAVSQIPMVLKSTKSINHRCAVFVVDIEDSTKLKVLEGAGYSLGGKQKLRLDSTSVAGVVYNKGKFIHAKDVTKDKNYKPHPKASKKILSLLCYPIIINDKVVGVLSIDGSEKNCFSSDDESYSRMFTNLFGVIFTTIGYDNRVELEEDDENGKIQVTG